MGDKGGHVATREGGVDRNTEKVEVEDNSLQVATREGGVDRNVNRGSGLNEEECRHP